MFNIYILKALKSMFTVLCKKWFWALRIVLPFVKKHSFNFTNHLYECSLETKLSHVSTPPFI